MMRENLRVLAVDDDPVLIEVYRKLFALPMSPLGVNRLLVQAEDVDSGEADRRPFELDTFMRGEEAVAAVEQSVAEERPYAVALVDVRMLPGIDGLETACRIRALDSALQIVFVTAYSDYTASEIRGLVNAPVLWFHKPFHNEELYQTVRNCCLSWNQAHQLSLLQNNLEEQVEEQRQRLEKKSHSLNILQKNVLSREQQMSGMKQEMSLVSQRLIEQIQLVIHNGLLSRVIVFHK